MINKDIKISKSIKNQLGLTLVEVMLAVAIGAFVMMGVFVLYRSAEANVKTSTAMSDVSNMLSQATALVDADPSGYESLNDITNYSKVDPWGNAYQLDYDGSVFTLTVQGIPNKASCLKIAQIASSIINENDQYTTDDLSNFCTSQNGTSYALSASLPYASPNATLKVNPQHN